MANICENEYVFIGKTKDINKLHSLIESSMKKNTEPYNKYWLGNILIDAGLGDRIDAGKNRLQCGGDITDIYEPYELFDGLSRLELFEDTRWVPMPIMWQAIIDKLGLTSVKFTYKAEEPGCELFQIYDPNNLGALECDDWWMYAILHGEDVNSKIAQFLESLSGVKVCEDEYIECLSSVSDLEYSLKDVFGEEAFGFKVCEENLENIFKHIKDNLKDPDSDLYFAAYEYVNEMFN